MIKFFEFVDFFYPYDIIEMTQAIFIAPNFFLEGKIYGLIYIINLTVWASQEALLIVTNIEPNKTIDVSDLTTCPVIQNSNDPPINDKSKPTFDLQSKLNDWL